MNDKIIAGIARSTLFQNLPLSVIHEIALQTEYLTFDEGAEIISQHAKAMHVYIIAEGEVRVHEHQHTLAKLGPAECFGELALIDHHARSTDVSAVGKVHLLAIPASIFDRVISEHKSVLTKILHNLTQRMRDQNHTLLNEWKQRATHLEQMVNARTRELEETKGEIVQSIEYALHLQKALLPSFDMLEKYLNDFFVINIPKDIVSGDFYWFTTINNHMVIAIGDCTGHGVSGAMMTMLGLTLLETIVKNNKCTDPSTILATMHKELTKLLHQNKNISHSSMDMALCVINLDTNLLQYAGANRPLWIWHRDVLEVYNPTKMSVGGTQLEEANFASIDVQLNHGNRLYLFSDGYADQFGGEDISSGGKKMMSKQMKNIITDTCTVTLEEQGILLVQYFHSWRNGMAQTDDVLVIGIEI